MDGLLPVWKPAGITSYDVIREVKHKVLKELPGKIKIGHAGTLDPFASGVLILMLGKATRRFDEIQTWQKTYRATAVTGARSDTLDCTGIIEKIPGSSLLTKEKIAAQTALFTGEIMQAIPKYSAAKYQGKALYKYARAGTEIPEKSKKVVIYSLSVEKAENDKVELAVTCSSGTYIRQLSYDLLHAAGAESYLSELIREKVGDISRADCLDISQLTLLDKVTQHLLPGGGES